ncbi:MAG TPA: hypothetical protein PLD84_03835 [Chitinophagales bacterium]|nr:hypothetical protein [Chitinophagales bacterium]
MRKTLSSLLLIAIAITGCFNLNAQTLTIPAASPVATVSQKFATSSIDLVYSRPSVKEEPSLVILFPTIRSGGPVPMLQQKFPLAKM